MIAGASTHPGKFGFVSLHNVLAAGYRGTVFATNLEATPVLGIETVASIEELPDGVADLVFVCTPKAANLDLLRAAAAKGITAAFLTSAGYGEAGEAGRRDEDELVALCDELGILLVGPNGQGVVSTPAALCAQIVAPYPPAGSHRGRQPVRQLRVELPELVVRHRGRDLPRRVGRKRGRDLGGRLPAVLRRRPGHGRRSRVHRGHRGRPRGCSTAADVARDDAPGAREGRCHRRGRRAAASHTGSLATDDRVFDGACRQAGVTRAATIEEAFEAAATFATQPLPVGQPCRGDDHGRRVGRGHRRCDHPHPDLELATLPDDLLAAIDHEAAAALEPEQPGRPRRRRDPRHDPRGDGDDRHPPRGRCDRLPRPRASSRTRRG